MNLFVDTGASLALRQDTPPEVPVVRRLRQALDEGEGVFTTGIVLQELLQGFSGPKDRDAILEQFAALPLLLPDRADHVEAAELRNRCRTRGIQVGTIDGLLAALCIRHELTMLTADDDFRHMARQCDLHIWGPGLERSPPTIVAR